MSPRVKDLNELEELKELMLAETRQEFGRVRANLGPDSASVGRLPEKIVSCIPTCRASMFSERLLTNAAR